METMLAPAGVLVTTTKNTMPAITVAIPKSNGTKEAFREAPPGSFFHPPRFFEATLLGVGDQGALGGGSFGADNWSSPSAPGRHNEKMIFARLVRVQHRKSHYFIF